MPGGLFNAVVLMIHFLFTFRQYRDEYLGKQRPTPSEADRLGATGVGTKEPSGYVENHDRFIQTDDNPARFVTHYSTKYAHIFFLCSFLEQLLTNAKKYFSLFRRMSIYNKS